MPVTGHLLAVFQDPIAEDEIPRLATHGRYDGTVAVERKWQIRLARADVVDVRRTRDASMDVRGDLRVVVVAEAEVKESIRKALWPVVADAAGQAEKPYLQSQLGRQLRKVVEAPRWGRAAHGALVKSKRLQRGGRRVLAGAVARTPRAYVCLYAMNMIISIKHIINTKTR